MKKIVRLTVWAIPMALASRDAFAWGLYTHVYFAQYLLCSVVLADPAFRRALKRFPESVLAGACLPDLSLFSSITGIPALRRTHTWTQAARLAERSESDRERALALGYASHLLADTVAHNRFVPSHESAWGDIPMVTHALSEWAMDGYVRNRLRLKPADLLGRNTSYLAGFVSAHFGCSTAESARTLAQLALGERVLRGTGIPQCLYAVISHLDSGTRFRFDRYLSATAGALHQINVVLSGYRPLLEPEPARHRVAARTLDRRSAVSG